MVLGRCLLLLLYIAPAAAAVVLRPLLLLLLQLVRGCHIDGAGDSRLGDGDGPIFYQTKNNNKL